ncbi:23004_t:CDS:2, partial [Racocetra persica]
GNNIKEFALCNNCVETDRIKRREKWHRDILPDERNISMPTDDKYEELDDNVSFSIIVEIENEMVDQEILSLEPGQDIENKKFCTLAKTQYIGCTTARLCCLK